MLVTQFVSGHVVVEIFDVTRRPCNYLEGFAFMIVMALDTFFRGHLAVRMKTFMSFYPQKNSFMTAKTFLLAHPACQVVTFDTFCYRVESVMCLRQITRRDKPTETETEVLGNRGCRG